MPPSRRRAIEGLGLPRVILCAGKGGKTSRKSKERGEDDSSPLSLLFVKDFQGSKGRKSPKGRRKRRKVLFAFSMVIRYKRISLFIFVFMKLYHFSAHSSTIRYGQNRNIFSNLNRHGLNQLRDLALNLFHAIFQFFGEMRNE